MLKHTNLLMPESWRQQHPLSFLVSSRRFIACLLLLWLVTIPISNASAGEVKTTPVRIIALEMADTENVLRLYVRRSIEIGAAPFDFNAAGCSSSQLRKSINTNGKNDGFTHFFDIPLDVTGRSTTTQRQLLNESFAAFTSGHLVNLYVSDNACTNLGSRLVTGIQLLR